MNETPPFRIASARVPALLSLTLTLAGLIPGCGNDPASDQPGSAPTLEQRMKKLGTCTPSDLVILSPWTGPAFGDDGRLLAPLPAGHVEAVVNGWAKQDRAAIELRERHGQIAVQDVFARPGLLGFEAVESAECDISMSHTLWKDEASMLAFVTGAAHAAAMADAPRMHHAFGGAHWTAAARTVAPTWREGIAQLVRSFGQ
jgi:heme-degrading monooxygenase HmoA